jgi:ABC-type branched-subunit amino acid transport system substrate-binding protein
MISVQNRRQLLNGNNFLIFLLVILGSTSCAAKKITSTKKVEVVEIKTKSTVRTFSSAAEKKRYEDSIARIAVPFDLEKSQDNNVINNSNTSISVGSVKVLNNDPNRIHNIAVLLPFNLDQIPLGMYVDDSTKQLTAESKNAMEFYLGCQMARQKFQSENLKTNVYFLDDRNDSLKVATIFTKKPFPNVDYVIGPIGYKNLKLAADLAKSNQIPLISPFASSIYLKENSYFFNANASLYNQYAFILEHTKNKFPNKVLEVIYDGKDSSAESINILKDLADKYYSYSNIKYTSLRASDDISKAMNQSDTLSQRIILIYSSKDVYVKSVIAKLKPIKNDLQIFTSAVAKNTKALADVKFPHDVYTVYSFNTGTINANIFSDRYEERYKRKPSDFANQGYDIMLHLFNMLDKNQNLQDYGKNYSLDFDNTQTRFQFKPVLNKAGNIDYYDNTFLYLYKYNGGGFSVVSPN